MVTYTAKLYHHTIPTKRSQVFDSPASTFGGLRYRESSYNKYKVGSLKTKRFTLQSSDPSHPSKTEKGQLPP